MAQKTTPPAESKLAPFVFGKTNYRLMLVSIAVVILGFFLMAGDTDIYSAGKIIIAPIVVLAGFGIGFYAILKKPANDN